MGQHRHGHPLYVLWQNEVAAGDHREGPSRREPCLRSAWGRAHRDRGMLTSRLCQIYAVANDISIYGDSFDPGLHSGECQCIDDGRDIHALTASCYAVEQHLLLALAPRVADYEPHHEPVELSLWERVGALVLNRIRRRNHMERSRERKALSFHRDLSLGHRLEQRRLRLGRGAVDLVG